MLACLKQSATNNYSFNCVLQSDIQSDALTFVQRTVSMCLKAEQGVWSRDFTAEDGRCYVGRWWSQGNPLIPTNQRHAADDHLKTEAMWIYNFPSPGVTYSGVCARQVSQAEVMLVKVTLGQTLDDHHVQSFDLLLMEESTPAAGDTFKLLLEHCRCIKEIYVTRGR